MQQTGSNRLDLPKSWLVGATNRSDCVYSAPSSGIRHPPAAISPTGWPPRSAAGPQVNFTLTVQAVSSDMVKVTIQYPGYKCLNAPTQAR